MIADTFSTLLNFDNGKGSKNKGDSSTLVIMFMALLCALLPLDISQLSIAIVGAVLYAALYNKDQIATKKKPCSTVADNASRNSATRAPKSKSPSARPPVAVGAQTKIPPSPVNPEVRMPSVQPIIAPTFHSDSWEGEVQELLLQITPSDEAEQIVTKLAQMVAHTLQSLIPEIEVSGYAHGNLAFGKAFGVAVPEVDIVASISPRILFNRLHGRGPHSGTAPIDEKKLQKTAIRACTDKLVSAAGFKFRRSAFRGLEPKVTLLAPASLGLFADSIPIDFSINAVTPLYNSALLTECGRMDSRTKELILIVKRWAKDRGICHAAKGHLSPYLWGLLAVYFCQVGDEEGPLLPSLEKFQMASGLLKGEHSALKHLAWKTPVQKKVSAATLFKEFVHFFETKFDWRNEAVSIRAARRAPPSSALPIHIMTSDVDSTSQVGPSIEDPFHVGQNLGDGMTSASLARLKEEFSRAEALCLRGASLSELLEPWAPPSESSEVRDDEGDGSYEVPTSQVAKTVQVASSGEDCPKVARSTGCMAKRLSSMAVPQVPAAQVMKSMQLSSSAKECQKKVVEVSRNSEDWRRDAMEAQADWRRDAMEAQATKSLAATAPWRRPDSSRNASKIVA